MNVFMIVKVSVRAIWRNKTRSALTMLGIIFGIAAVIMVLAIGKGASANMVAQIGKMGDNVVMIFSEQRSATRRRACTAARARARASRRPTASPSGASSRTS